PAWSSSAALLDVSLFIRLSARMLTDKQVEEIRRGVDGGTRGPVLIKWVRELLDDREERARYRISNPGPAAEARRLVLLENENAALRTKLARLTTEIESLVAAARRRWSLRALPSSASARRFGLGKD